MLVGTANSIDDVNADGSAVLWWWKDGDSPNEKYKCSCIFDMMTSKELFGMLVNDYAVDIEPDRFYRYCTKI
jgi:hypothetical protein